MSVVAATFFYLGSRFSSLSQEDQRLLRISRRLNDAID